MRVILRADASPTIGTGHVMRCMALAQALLERGDSPAFLCCEMPESLEARVRSEGIEVERVEAERGSEADLAELLSRPGAVVLDGYEFSLSFQQGVRAAERRLCMVDDYAHQDGYEADLLLNQNLHAEEAMYRGQTVGRFLCGPKYALLRREFWEQRDKYASVKTRRVLVTLGGSDPENVTRKVVAGLKRVTLEGVEARVVVGPTYAHRENLETLARRPGCAVEILSGVASMRELYEWADLAISAGGSTTWELAFVGLPSLVIILAENQEAIARSLWRAGIGRLLGWHHQVTEDQIKLAVRELLVSSETRDQMGRWARRLVDGQGARRVAEALREVAA